MEVQSLYDFAALATAALPLIGEAIGSALILGTGVFLCMVIWRQLKWFLVKPSENDFDLYD